MDPTAFPILAQREISNHHYDANVSVNQLMAVKDLVSYLRLPHTFRCVFTLIERI